MAAYSPIAMKVFGSSHVGLNHKLHFMTSLVLSRLFFNVHILVLKARDLMKLNAVYMGVLRRIADDVRHGPTCYNDVQVRALLHQPLVDCLLLRARLRYIGRLLRHRPRPLLALLHVRHRAKRLPWVAQVLTDLEMARLRSSSADFAALPLPEGEMNPWVE
eukprot:10436683-Karenia_brevis.AAC.1